MRTMEISFKGPKLKVKRAYKHIAELEAWIGDIIQSNADAILAHKNNTPGSESDMVTVVRPSGFSECVAPIVGDIAHNLRAALDLAASAIVAAHGEDPSNTYFPFSDTRQRLIGSKSYRLIEGVAPDLALIIADVIKPYETDDSRLWALNRLDRMDKHRVLIPTVTTSHHLTIAIREEDEDDPPPAPPGSIYMIPMVLNSGGFFESEGRAPRPGSKAYIHNQRNGYPTVEIAFGKGEVFEGEPIIPTLRQLADLVGGVIDTLEAHCQGR
jgi:hypothetical protein